MTFLTSSGHEHWLANSFSADLGSNLLTASAAALLRRPWKYQIRKLEDNIKREEKEKKIIVVDPTSTKDQSLSLYISRCKLQSHGFMELS